LKVIGIQISLIGIENLQFLGAAGKVPIPVIPLLQLDFIDWHLDDIEWMLGTASSFRLTCPKL